MSVPRGRLRLVVAASTAGTAFEWYDFFVFVPLSAFIAKNFFAELNEATSFIMALAAFAAGLAFRPLGALIFGRMGDRIGRKSTFLVTITLMGVSTILIGCLPTYAQAGVLAPILFVFLRILQGLALGGEWGGAAIYIAEHSPPERRGVLASWMGPAAAFGLGGALIVTLGVRSLLSEADFSAWGWRIPFLASAILLVLSLWIRLKLHESPMFQKLVETGQRSTAPFRESFGQWSSLRNVLIMLFSLVAAQGAVWFTVFFYSQFFLERILKVDPGTVNSLMIAVVLASAPLYVFFGWLSDRVGRKPVMVFGLLVAAAGLYPAFQALTHAANPALARAAALSPVVVFADPATCALQFDPVGKSQFSSSCDIAQSVLANAGVPYRRQDAPPGRVTIVEVGARRIESAEGAMLSPEELRALRAAIAQRIGDALREAGYPAQADPAQVDRLQLFVILMLLAVGATALYGPQPACLVELFPTRIRYTALSLPYHIGTGWVGGFLPATAYAMTVATGDIYYGLWYPIIVATVSVIVALLFLPETRRRSLD